WTTAAAAATIRYNRLALMGHRVEPAGAGPAAHGNQPPGIGGDEGPELARRRRFRAGEEDVGDALALEVRPLVGRGGLDHSRPAAPRQYQPWQDSPKKATGGKGPDGEDGQVPGEREADTGAPTERGETIHSDTQRR